jgi:hypothetical protein
VLGGLFNTLPQGSNLEIRYRQTFVVEYVFGSQNTRGVFVILIVGRNHRHDDQTVHLKWMRQDDMEMLAKSEVGEKRVTRFHRQAS